MRKNYAGNLRNSLSEISIRLMPPERNNLRSDFTTIVTLNGVELINNLDSFCSLEIIDCALTHKIKYILCNVNQPT